MARAPKVQRRPAREAVVGGVYTYQLPDGRYGACQVLAESDPDDSIYAGLVLVGTLDVLSVERPTADSVSTLQVARNRHAFHSGQPALANYDRQLPWWLELVCVIDPVEQFPKGSNVSGNWYVQEVHHRERWEALGLDVAKRDDSPVSIDLGVGPYEVRRDLPKLTIGPEGGYELPTDAPADFASLPTFPALTDLDYAGGDARLIGYVERQPIQHLTWTAHGQSAIDLSASLLNRLTIEVAEPLTLRPPSSLEWLIVDGDASLLTVENIDPRWPFDLTVRHPVITAPPRGLEAVQCVTLDRLVESGSEALKGYTDLRELRLYGAPGRLTDAAGVIAQQSLRILWAFGLYGLDGSSWHRDDGWPMLDDVLVSGLHKDDAAPIKAALAAVPTVKITGARSDAWIAANLDNPFRDWDNDGAAFGKAARTAWKKAKTAAQKLGPVGPTPEANTVLETLVLALNKLNARYDIDTMRREDAFEAYLGIAGDLGIDDDVSGPLFDQTRDF